MLYVERRDMFGLRADAYVHTANTVGAMGRGVALRFRERWPVYTAHYHRQCRSAHLRKGDVDFWPGRGPEAPVITACTKGDWRKPSDLPTVETIAIRLWALEGTLLANGIHLVSMPPLGCGNGGLNWADVEEVLVDQLEKSAVTYVVCL